MQERPKEYENTEEAVKEITDQYNEGYDVESSRSSSKSIPLVPPSSRVYDNDNPVWQKY